MRGALQFLTILPVPAPPQPPGRAAWAFPLVGILLGLVLAPLWPWKLGPLAIVILLAILTGGLHEDGLADVCDAVRAYRSREKMLLILRDSRIGAHGAAALVCSLLFRWQALAGMQGNVWLRLPAALGLSRAFMVLLAAWAPAAGEGLGRAFGESLPRGAAVVALGQAGLLAALCGWPAGAAALAANLLLLAAMRRWFQERLGGVTGDCLGAMCQVSEAVTLGVLAWA
ncbi:MAG TPA: adenosylcobinamide-GDP ribazoletransferase [Bryobacteraceae bacterium]|nr:adenosylcobinamide-GDP ribazoletransferase [Bryobacteraceae bacterium]